MGLGGQDGVVEVLQVESVKKKSGSSLKITSFLSPKKSVSLKLTLADNTHEWDIIKSHADVVNLHKVLKREFEDIRVPDLPHMPTSAKSGNLPEWLTFFKVILDDPTYSESGYLRTFISAQTKEDEEGMNVQFGEVIKEGPLIFKKKSKKYKKYRPIDCWCVIRLRMFYFYKSRFDTTPMGMLPLDDCAIDVKEAKNPKELPVKAFSAVGMSVEESMSPKHNTVEKKQDTLTLTPRGSHKYRFVPASPEDKQEWLDAIEKVAKSRATTHFRVVSTLLVQIEKAVQLSPKDANGFADPFAIAHIENQQQKTATIRKTLDPVWHETYQFHVSWYSAVLYLSVWDEDTLRSADFLGKVAIPVAALPVDEEVDIWTALAPRDKHKVSGMLHLRIKYSFTIAEEERLDAKRVFGVPVSLDNPVPPIIKRAMNYIEDSALDVEGLFRLSANSIELNEMRRSIDQGNDMEFNSSVNIHNISGLVKLWLRELPEPALTFDAYPRFLAAFRTSKPDTVLPALQACMASLPEAHKLLLAELLPFLYRVSQAQDKTRMTTANLAVVFSPSLLRAKVESLDSLMVDSVDCGKVTALLIDNASALLEPS